MFAHCDYIVAIIAHDNDAASVFSFVLFSSRRSVQHNTTEDLIGERINDRIYNFDNVLSGFVKTNINLKQLIHRRL